MERGAGGAAGAASALPYPARGRRRSRRGEGFWSAFERELEAPLEPALAGAGGGGAATLGGLEPLPLRAQPARGVRDRRGEGIAGVAGDLIASGESVLVVCADVPRRRAGLEKTIAGKTGIRGIADTPLPVCSWADLARDPAPAAAYAHVVALDPPVHAAADEALAGLPGDGFAHWRGARRRSSSRGT